MECVVRRGDNGGAEEWWGLSYALSAELEAMLEERSGGGDVEIEFQSYERGTILVDGVVVFDVTISETRLVEPYRLNAQLTEMTYCGPIWGRCTIMSRDGKGMMGGGGKGAAGGGEGKKRSAAVLDMQAVKDLQGNAPPKKKKMSTGLKAEQTVGKLRKKSSSRKGGGAVSSAAGSNGLTTSCVVLKALPLHVTVGQIDSFFSGLDAIEVYAVPNHVEYTLTELGSHSFQGTANLFVVFSSPVSAQLAEMRSGESMHMLSSGSKMLMVKPVVQVVSEDDMLLPRGMGLRLVMSSGKSSSAASKLENILTYAATIFFRQDDMEIFRNFLLCQDEALALKEVEKAIAEMQWKPKFVFNPMLSFTSATIGDTKGSKKKKGKKQEAQAVVAVEDPFNAANEVPPQWNAVLIHETLSRCCSTVHELELVSRVERNLRLVKLLQGLAILASTRVYEGGVSPSTKPEVDLAEHLKRLCTMLSAVHTVLFRKSVLSSN